MSKSRQESIKEITELTQKIKDKIKSDMTLSMTDKKDKLRKLAQINRIIETADGLVADLESELPIGEVISNVRERLFVHPLPLFESGGMISKSKSNEQNTST